MNIKLIGALAAVLLSGCEDTCVGTSADISVANQCLNREIFQQCLKALPAGPQAAKYNDWDEVIIECRRTAYYQSLRKKSQIKEECRSE